jgi:hypothetical protein
VPVVVFAHLGPPFTCNLEGATNCPSLHHKCGILTYTTSSPLCRVTESLCQTQESSLCFTLSPQIHSRGVHLKRILVSYPYMTSHPPGLAHHRPGCTCLDTVHYPICLGIDAPHDVVVWCRLTVFCGPTSRVRHQVDRY